MAKFLGQPACLISRLMISFYGADLELWGLADLNNLKCRISEENNVLSPAMLLSIKESVIKEFINASVLMDNI